MLSLASGPLVLASLRAQVPEQERPFRLPGGHTIPLLAFWGANLVIYWSGWTTVWKLMIAVLIGFVLLVLSAAVYVMAYRFRLSPQAAQAYIDETTAEAALEDEELGSADA